MLSGVAQELTIDLLITMPSRSPWHAKVYLWNSTFQNCVIARESEISTLVQKTLTGIFPEI
jgi:hypothetical protein